MRVPRQCAILVGGLGTRLGSLTVDMPKPLLDCGGKPFLAWVLRELLRFGIRDFVLLAGYRSEQVEEFVQHARAWLPTEVTIRLSIEPALAGTGGALWHARELFEETFLLINGDSWIDTNLARFFFEASKMEAACVLLLRPMADCTRYGTVQIDEGRVSAFLEKSNHQGPGLISSGIYLFERSVLKLLSPKCSIELDILPALVASKQLAASIHDGYFVDIGIPSDYFRAQKEIPTHLIRPAVIFDADILLSFNPALTNKSAPFSWQIGAVQLLRSLCDAGYHCFMTSPDSTLTRKFLADIFYEALKLGTTLRGVSAGDQSSAIEAFEAQFSFWEIDRDRSFYVARQGDYIFAAQELRIQYVSTFQNSSGIDVQGLLATMLHGSARASLYLSE